MFRMRVFILCCSVLLIQDSAHCMTPGGRLTIVEAGQARAEIVMSEDALSSVKAAAQDLRTYIEKISGATLPVVQEPSENGVIPIYVGDSAPFRKLGISLEKLPLEGFKIVVRDNFIALVGRDEQRSSFPFSKHVPGGTKRWQDFSGQLSNPPEDIQIGDEVGNLKFRSLDATATFYAVSTFLEKLGVRWYAPYEDGTVIPEIKTIEIPVQELAMNPLFPYREIWGLRGDGDGLLWLKRLKTGSSYVYTNDAHSIDDILNTQAMSEAHPEYYARSGGQPIVGQKGSHPKLSDPGFRDASFVFLNKAIEAYPSMLTTTLGMPDAFGAIDEDDSKKWVKPDAHADGVFSDYVWDYWLDMADRLKKAQPGKYLNCYSYTSYQRPPDSIEKLPENVALTMIYSVSKSMLPEYTEHRTPMRDKWISMLTSGKFFLWEYVIYYWSNNPTVPIVFTKILQEEMRRMQGTLQGKFTECTRVRTVDDRFRLDHPALTHLLLYLQAKLYWNPDMDLQGLLNEYYELYYGPAKAEMKEFWEFSEEVWTRRESRSITPTTGYLKEKDVARYFDLLAKARQKVESGGVYDRRIAGLETEMAPLRNYFQRLTRTGPAFQGKVQEIPAKIDGNLDKPIWQNGPWYDMRELVSSHPMADRIRTKVAFRLSPDRTRLLIGVQCAEVEMEKRVAKAAKRDDAAIFGDDAVEIYLESPERSYFKIVVNSEGLIWDESHDSMIVERDTMPVLWNPAIQVATHKTAKSWSAEISIPTADLGNSSLGPASGHHWGINVCRARWVTGAIEAFAISPTGELFFGKLTKLGSLTVR